MGIYSWIRYPFGLSFKASCKRTDLDDYDIFIFRGYYFNRTEARLIAERMLFLGKVVLDEILGKNFIVGKMFLSSRKLQYVTGAVFLLGAGVSIYAYGFYFENFMRFYTPEYSLATSLTHDTYSQSANVKVYVPDGMSKEVAMENVSIVPNISGEWSFEGDRILAFDPANKLRKGRHYAILLVKQGDTLGKDFYVDDNPRVLSIFPSSEAEADEESEITIAFNRPMVPLSTLDAMIVEDVPVTIEPETEGVFEWIGTRTLQFKPTESLLPASHYSVKVRSDLKSLDGVPVDAFEHDFDTRHLRILHSSSGSLSFSSPVQYRFNQEVDIDSFRKNIKAKGVGATDNPEVIVEYGKEKNEETGEQQENKEEVLVYKAQDRFGRAKLWDFEQNYSLSVNRINSLRGDIPYKGKYDVDIDIKPIIDSVTAQSDRYRNVKPDFFDPEGVLAIRLFEEIDLEKSVIRGDNVRSVEYGQKCKYAAAENTSYEHNKVCDTESDKKKLLVTFDSSKIGRSEEVIVRLEKIINTDGIQLADEAIESRVVTIPSLSVRQFFHKDESSDAASLDSMTLCSSVPLYSPGGEDDPEKALENFMHANELFLLRSVYASSYMGAYYCGDEEFSMSVQYNLLPDTKYDISLQLQDIFGEKNKFKFELKTKQPTRDVIQTIHYQTRYGQNITTPERTKLAYGVKYMDFVDVEICKTDAMQYMDLMRHKNGNYWSRKPGEVQCSDTKKDTIQLSNVKNPWEQKFFHIDINKYYPDQVGYFIVYLSNPNFIDHDGEQEYDTTLITVTNLGIVEKKVKLTESARSEEDQLNAGNLYWVFDLNTLEPIRDASVQAYKSAYKRENGEAERAVRRSYSESYMEKKEDVRTDKHGIARTSVKHDHSYVLVERDGDSAILGSYQETLERSSYGSVQEKVYVYTDRPIYRPGQEVHMKALLRIGYDGAYDFYPDREVKVTVTGSSRNVIYNGAAFISEYGAIHASFAVPEEANLGTYTVEVEGYNGKGSFDVEEYVASPYKVDVSIIILCFSIWVSSERL